VAGKTKEVRASIDKAADQDVFPPSLFPGFLDSLRRALDVGLEPNQISAIVFLASAVAELHGCFEGRGLQERVEGIIGSLRGFPRSAVEEAAEDWFTG